MRALLEEVQSAADGIALSEVPSPPPHLKAALDLRLSGSVAPSDLFSWDRFDLLVKWAYAKEVHAALVNSSRGGSAGNGNNISTLIHSFNS